MSLSRPFAPLLLLLLCACMAACSSSEKTTGQPDPNPVQTQPTLLPTTPATSEADVLKKLDGSQEPIYGPTFSGSQAFALVIEASVGVLRDYGFAIDRQDYRYGLVTSRPLVAPTIFEFWRPTNTSTDQMLEATLNNQRRIVRIRLHPISRPLDVGTEYQVSVQVQLQRLQQPLRTLNGSTRGNAIVSRLSSVPAEWADRGITRAYWLADGYDPLLAERILYDIAERANLTMPGADGRSIGMPRATYQSR
jgi:hypothetical protein